MSLIQSLLIGLSIAAIPGPIFFELIRRTLTKGLFSGLLLAFGEFLGNFLLLILIFFGLSTFFSSSNVSFILYLLGAIILLFLGVKAIKLNKKEIQEKQNKKFKKDNSFAVGFLIAISSPIVIALWISLSGSYLVQFSSNELAFLNILFIALGVFLLFLTFIIMIYYTKHKIPSKQIIFMSKIFGVILIIFGLSFIW